MNLWFDKIKNIHIFQSKHVGTNIIFYHSEKLSMQLKKRNELVMLTYSLDTVAVG